MYICIYIYIYIYYVSIYILCLSVFDHFVGWALKGLTEFQTESQRAVPASYLYITTAMTWSFNVGISNL